MPAPDYVEILMISKLAFENAVVPDSWREAFGRMYGEPVGEEEQGEEIEPSFAMYLPFIGEPGGHTLFLSLVEGEWEPAEVYEYAFVFIPWDRVSASASISTMKDDLFTMLSAAGSTYQGRMLSIPQFHREYPIRQEEI